MIWFHLSYLPRVFFSLWRGGETFKISRGSVGFLPHKNSASCSRVLWNCSTSSFGVLVSVFIVLSSFVFPFDLFFLPNCHSHEPFHCIPIFFRCQFWIVLSPSSLLSKLPFYWKVLSSVLVANILVWHQQLALAPRMTPSYTLHIFLVPSTVVSLSWFPYMW